MSFGSSLREVSTRVRELGALCVAVLRKLDQLCVVVGGFCAFACGLRGTRGAGVASEAVGLAYMRGLVFLQRLRRLIELEEHIAEELARREDAAGRDDAFLVPVFE